MEVIKPIDRPKKEHQRLQLIVALLQEPNLARAARSVGISSVTAWRMARTVEFQEEYRRARREAFAQALGRLQQAANAAVSTLIEVMEDSERPSAVRLRAAESILRHASKSFEEDLAASIHRIEQHVEQAGDQDETPEGEEQQPTGT